MESTMVVQQEEANIEKKLMTIICIHIQEFQQQTFSERIWDTFHTKVPIKKVYLRHVE